MFVQAPSSKPTAWSVRFDTRHTGAVLGFLESRVPDLRFLCHELQGDDDTDQNPGLVSSLASGFCYGLRSSRGSVSACSIVSARLVIVSRRECSLMCVLHTYTTKFKIFSKPRLFYGRGGRGRGRSWWAWTWRPCWRGSGFPWHRGPVSVETTSQKTLKSITLSSLGFEALASRGIGGR
jgi:hypothetical protein